MGWSEETDCLLAILFLELACNFKQKPFPKCLSVIQSALLAALVTLLLLSG